jgi:NADPH:quinone reductase-like Zn-dependent oxidoreductase
MAPMTVIEITGAGGPEVLQVKQRPIPIPRQGEVLIKLAYAGINRPDVLQRSGSYNPPKGASDLPGLEGAGIISAIGSGSLSGKLATKYVPYFLVVAMQSMRLLPQYTACPYLKACL